MKLPIPFFKKSQNENKYYLVLTIVDDKVSSAVLEAIDEKLKIIGTYKEKISSNFESLLPNEQIIIIDKIISRSEEKLPPNIETHKTIFGVKEDWVEKDTKKIKKEYLNRLKKICDKLDLTPIGFMVINEAIVNLLQAEDGSPLSAIVADLGKSAVRLMLFRGGHIAESVSGQIHESPSETIDNLLKKFTAPVLPSKLIIINSDEDDILSEKLNNYQWSKSLPFLHVPQISILPSDFNMKAVIFGAAAQLGFDIVGLHTFDTHKMSNNIKNEQEEIDKTGDVVKQTTNTDDLTVDTDTDFGFIENKDIADNPSLITKTHKLKDNQPLETESKTNIIVNHNDIQFSDNSNKSEDNEILEQDLNLNLHTEKKDKKNRITTSIVGIFDNFKKPSVSYFTNLLKLNNKSKIIGLITIAVFIFIGILLFSLYKNSKAEITLTVKPEEVNVEKKVNFSASAGNNFSKNIIAAETVSTTIDGELSAPSSGKKDVGDKAKGSVTVYNSGSSPATLNNGTEIESSNGLKFILGDDIKIASASGDIFSGTTPGTANVKIEAKDIGSESNLPSGTKFSVGSNSSLAAKNDDALSGGNKKNVTVVSEKDMSELKKSLLSKLEKEAIKKLSTKTANNIIIPTILESNFEKEKYDKKVNEEANKFNLSGTIVFTSLSYKKTHLNDYAKSVLKDKHSEDIIFADNNIDIKIENLENTNSNSIDATIKVKAGLLPEINTNDVIRKIKNKSPKEARNMLTSLPQVEKIDIKYNPNILYISYLFPRLPEDINIKIKSK